MIVSLLFSLIFSVISLPYIFREIHDQYIDSLEEYEFVIPEDTFRSTKNATITISVSSTNDWITSGSGSDIIQVGYYFPVFTQVQVVGDLAYVSDEFYGLRVIDVSDPFNPVLKGSLRLTSTDFEDVILDLHVIYPHVFLACYSRGLRIVDVSDLNDIVVVSSYVDSDVSTMETQGVFVREDDYAFIASEDWLTILDVSNITNPTFVSKAELRPSFTVNANRVFVLGDTAYVSGSGTGLNSVDISDIHHPAFLDYYSSIAYDVFVDSEGECDYAYVSYGSSNLKILNVTIKEDITHVGTTTGVTCPSNVRAATYQASNKMAFATSCQGTKTFCTVDTSDKTDLSNCYCVNDEQSYCDSLIIHGIQTVDDYLAYTATGKTGLKVYNITDPIQPTLLSQYGHASSLAIDVTVAGNIMYVLDDVFGLKVVDVTDKAHPVQIGIFQRDLSRDYDYFCLFLDEEEPQKILYLSEKVTTYRNFVILDISDPTNVTEIATYTWDIFGDIVDMWVHNKVAYLLRGTDIYILDLSNINSPSLIKIIDESVTLSSIVVRGNYAYVLSKSSREMIIYDISVPANTYKLTTFTDSAFGNDKLEGLSVADDVVYIAVARNLGDNKLVLVNVANKTSPYVINFLEFDSDANPTDIFFHNNYAYIADTMKGLVIVHINSDNYNMTLNGTYSLRVDPTAVYVDRGYIYVAESSVGVRIFGGKLTVLNSNRGDKWHCGEVTVDVYASDSHGQVIDSFQVTRSYNSSDPSLLCGGRGECYDYDQCSCEVEKYTGDTCQYPVCFGVPSNLVGVCSGHGECLGWNQCNCSQPSVFDGPNCQFMYCFDERSDDTNNVCGGHGNCIETDKCSCTIGYSSREGDFFGPCVVYSCDGKVYDDKNVCSGHGKCVSYNLCECDGKYEGNGCDTWKCGAEDFKDAGKVCSGHGDCTEPEVCDCNYGYSGERCDTNQLVGIILAPTMSMLGVMVVSSLLFCCCAFCCVCCIVCASLDFCLCYMGVVVFRQKVGLKKFGKLRDFDLLLREQEMEDDTSIAHLHINMELFKVDFNEVKLEKILGEGGSNSTVYKALWNEKVVAFKCFRTRTVCSSQDSFDEFEREVMILGSVNHPNILQFFGCCLKPPRVGILMEFCENGDLVFFLRRSRKDGGVGLSFHEKLRILSSIGYAMTYLHSRNVIHRDLKLENVLMDGSNDCKIMDFGLSKIVDRMSQMKTTRIGTSCYMAPELMDGTGNYDGKVDVFSFSICLFIILTEIFHPYGIEEMSVEIKVAMDENYRPDIKKMEGYVPDEELIWLQDLTTKCWAHKPQDRPSFKDAVAEIREGLDRAKIAKEKFLLQPGGENNSSKNSNAQAAVNVGQNDDAFVMMMDDENEMVKISSMEYEGLKKSEDRCGWLEEELKKANLKIKNLLEKDVV